MKKLALLLVFIFALFTNSYLFSQRTATQGELEGLGEVAGTIHSTRLSDNKVLIIYKNSTATTTVNDLKAVIGTVSGSNISFGTPVVIVNTETMYFPKVVAFSESKQL